MSTTKPSHPGTSAEPEALADATSPAREPALRDDRGASSISASADLDAGHGDEPNWDGDPTSATVVPVLPADSFLENPMWSEKTAIAPAAPPPAAQAPQSSASPTSLGVPVVAGEVAAAESMAATAAPLGGAARPLAATMAGPVALAGASAEAIPVSVGGQPIAPGRAPQEAPVDGYLNMVVAERYRVLKKLGEGGMGTVYLAEHIIIEKKVALKVLSEDFARKADLVQRFMQEAKAASRIGHENIVDIHDFGETPSGSVFIAMEYLEGSDLANVIRTSGALSFERARFIVSQICRALGAAHAKGIIHRDMKPENVYLVEREGRPDFVKILDFGIAKISSLGDEGGARLTRTGMIFGTPEYMSPEQARGDRPDHRVDIYAVGCILYELLTGDVPFHADTFMGVLTKHMFEQPQPLSVIAPDRNIPPGVEAVVLKAIAKDRDHRYQSMKEMSLALAACGGDGFEGWGNEPSGVKELPSGTTRSASTQRSLSPQTAAPVTQAATATAATPKKSNLTWLAGAGMVAIVTIAAGATVALRKPPPVEPAPPASPVTAPATAGSATVTPPTAPAVAPPVPTAAPAAPTSATITINSKPPGAEVYLGADLLGITPFKHTVPVDAKPLSLLLRKRDFKDRELQVAQDKDVTYDLELAPVRRTSSRPTAKPPTLPALPPPVAHPPPPPPTRPAGRLRDLKDPFSDEPKKPGH